jgi:16S rRNA G966 N2-methylase RsmD
MMRTARLKELLKEPKNLEFIRQNLQANCNKLLFKYSEDSDKRLLIEQINLRQNIRKKLPTFYNDPALILAPRLNLEQTSSEVLAQFKANLVIPGSKCVDLTAGLGIDFWQLLSKFKTGIYNEPSQDLQDIAAYNFNFLSTKAILFSGATAEAFLSKNQTPLDLIYLDPSRRDNQSKPLYRVEDYQPNLIEIWASLKQQSKQVLVKLSPMISIHEYLMILDDVHEVWINSYRNECKEICLYYNEDSTLRIPKIRTFNHQEKHIQTLEADWGTKAKVNFGPVEEYLYLANVSIAKAQLQDLCAETFNLNKLDQNSNIFTSNIRHSDFPGRQFKVINTGKAYDKKWKRKNLQVITRNFPDKAEIIHKKLGLKAKGAKDFLIATTINSKGIFIEAEWLFN